MSKSMKELFGALAQALEDAGAAAREIEGSAFLEAAKSAGAVSDAVASGDTGSKAKASAGAVAAKPAKAGKAKAPAITYEVLKAKFTELVNTKGKEAAVKILSDFGAPKLVDLSEDDYAEVHSQVVAAIADEEPEAASTDDDDMFGA